MLKKCIEKISKNIIVHCLITFPFLSNLVSQPRGKSLTESANRLINATKSLLCWYRSNVDGSRRIFDTMCFRDPLRLYRVSASCNKVKKILIQIFSCYIILFFVCNGFIFGVLCRRSIGCQRSVTIYKITIKNTIKIILVNEHYNL